VLWSEIFEEAYDNGKTYTKHIPKHIPVHIPKHIPAYTKHIPKHIPVENEINDKENNNICRFCNNIFSCYYSKWRHEKYRCKIKKQQIIIHNNKLDELEELKNKINTLENKKEISMMNSNNTNTNSNNTINVINLRAYNDPNMEHVNMKYLNNLFKKLNVTDGTNGLFEIIKDTQCNKNYKENMNIVLPSLKNRKFIKVFNGSEWEMQLRKQIFDEIITKYFKFNENIIEEIKKNKSLENKFFYLFFTSRKIDFKFDENYNDDGYKKVYKDLCDKLEVEFYNNKDSVNE